MIMEGDLNDLIADIKQAGIDVYEKVGNGGDEYHLDIGQYRLASMVARNGGEPDITAYQGTSYGLHAHLGHLLALHYIAMRRNVPFKVVDNHKNRVFPRT
ncbi:MAG: hypothetical protein HYT70_03415 [Candidatus Aenigmarchaeota archaeon]|nr:hypothetical protein [Candidatus Aenigmarchaeota archaeon]